MTVFEKISDFIRALIKDSVSSALTLFKVMIPIVILVKILQELNLIQYLAMPLKPIMVLMGLPAETGLIWAAALLNNIYTGLIVFMSLANDISLTQAQATILATLMLIAHALPLEAAVSKKAGAKFMFQALIRIVGALSLGILLHAVYSSTGMLTEPAKILLTTPSQTETSIATWAIGQIRDFSAIFMIILTLMALMRILTAIGVIDILNRILRPILKLIGIGPKASAITVIGLTVGLTYGSGLIIQEAKSGNIGKEDVFYSLTLMGLSHAMIEDTLLLLLIGAHFSGIFWGRLLFSLAVVAILVRAASLLSPRIKNTYFWEDVSSKTIDT